MSGLSHLNIFLFEIVVKFVHIFFFGSRDVVGCLFVFRGAAASSLCQHKLKFVQFVNSVCITGVSMSDAFVQTLVPMYWSKKRRKKKE